MILNYIFLIEKTVKTSGFGYSFRSSPLKTKKPYAFFEMYIGVPPSKICPKFA